MKLTATLLTGLLATSASAAFDKWSPWGKRDYSCVNILQGIPENATVAANTAIEIKFDRDSGRCDESLSAYPADNYNVWLYNNPVRNMGISWDAQVKVLGDVPADAGSMTVTIPDNLPEVEDDSVWYMRVDTVLATAPQMPSLFYAMGPFRIRR
ncbi:hypothetical protein BJX61DRAFT_136858 [Aspergillus egyptiacus]|nr:hypothetical protein BJX61DRAFT_136858 [Aspergillus egyptiacus]